MSAGPIKSKRRFQKSKRWFGGAITGNVAFFISNGLRCQEGFQKNLFFFLAVEEALEMGGRCAAFMPHPR
jgi:hypothetical protein